MADVRALHRYNNIHIADHAEHGIETSLVALKELAEHRPEMLRADLLRSFVVEINSLIRRANMAEINQKLIERGRV